MDTQYMLIQKIFSKSPKQLTANFQAPCTIAYMYVHETSYT